MTYRIIEGDALERLAELDAGSVQTCITSPPYWGLRDYGTATWDGGDAECDHIRTTQHDQPESRPKGWDGSFRNTSRPLPIAYAGVCGKCGATRIDSQFGLEPTPEAYVANLVSVFREVRRVLRDDGTLWLNLGDSYAANGRYDEQYEAQNPDRRSISNLDYQKHGGTGRKGYRGNGIKPKDLVGIPWMVAFALRADGWYLRSDIIWAKPNPMPESVTDRPTKAHEYLFLLSKSPRYFYDADAIREDSIGGHGSGVYERGGNHQNGRSGFSTKVPWDDEASGRNKRSVWTVTTQPFPGAHFATFPPKLIEPCVLAGSRPIGATIEPEVIATPLGERNGDDPSLVTGRAGMNRPRHSEEGTRLITVAEQRDYAAQLRCSPHREAMADEAGESFAHYLRTDASGARPIPPNLLARWINRGWLVGVPRPAPVAAEQSSSVVLDPFAGAGTTGVVALRNNRSFVGIELNPDYARMARNRIHDDGPLFNVEAVDG